MRSGNSGDRPREACGLFGIYADPEAAQKTYFGLCAQQHRGEESAGIAVSDRISVRGHRGMGLVDGVFDRNRLRALKGSMAIGHVRYSTTGSSVPANAQPLLVQCAGGPIAVAHNGNLVNGAALRNRLEQQGSIFQTTCDSEVVLHLLSRPEHGGRLECLPQCLRQLRGAFSLLFLTLDALWAVRDPCGLRPLCLGRAGDALLVASETCAFDLIGGTYERDVQPGELVRIDRDGFHSELFVEPGEITPAFCIFEHIYFARPDSRVYGETVHLVRQRMGRELACEQPADADLVVAVPESGSSAALGYAKESVIPLERGFIRNHYVGRTFIQPVQSMREVGVEIKLNAVEEVVRGKRVVVVDDSVIRGTTVRLRVRHLRRCGAKEIHMRICCPPHRYGCHYGIDFPSRHELIANRLDARGIQSELGLDSMGYLSKEGMLRSVVGSPNHYCIACFTGRYPVPIDPEFEKHIMEKPRKGHCFMVDG